MKIVGACGCPAFAWAAVRPEPVLSRAEGRSGAKAKGSGRTGPQGGVGRRDACAPRLRGQTIAGPGNHRGLPLPSLAPGGQPRPVSGFLHPLLGRVMRILWLAPAGRAGRTLTRPSGPPSPKGRGSKKPLSPWERGWGEGKTATHGNVQHTSEEGMTRLRPMLPSRWEGDGGAASTGMMEGSDRLRHKPVTLGGRPTSVSGRAGQSAESRRWPAAPPATPGAG